MKNEEIKLITSISVHIDNANQFLRLVRERETILNNIELANKKNHKESKEWALKTLKEMLRFVEDKIHKNKLDFIAEIDYIKKALSNEKSNNQT